MMTQEEIAELVRQLRYMSAVWNDNRNLLEAADVLEQQAREIAALNTDARHYVKERQKSEEEIKHLRNGLEACEGALRNMARDLNDLAKRYWWSMS